MNCQSMCYKEGKDWMDLVFEQQRRPRLFNWISILLLTSWVILVAIVAQTGDRHGADVRDEVRDTVPLETFIDQLIR